MAAGPLRRFVRGARLLGYNRAVARQQTQAERIRALAAKGFSPSEIVEKLGVPRPSVQSALRHTGPRGRPSEGKDSKISLRLPGELVAAIERARAECETFSDCLIRVIQRGLR